MSKKTSEESEESESKERREDDPKFEDPYSYLCLGMIEGRNAHLLKEVRDGKPERAVRFLEKCNDAPAQEL